MWANETKQHVLPQVTTGMGSLYLMENCFLCCYQFEINLCCGHKKAWHADRNLQECELITVEPLEGGPELRIREANAFIYKVGRWCGALMMSGPKGDP